MTSVFETHGACSWIELTTTNKARTIEFYSSLLGWKVEDFPMADGSNYALIKVGDQGIGGIVENPGGASDRSGWGIYITVDSVDKTLARVESLGGKVLSPAFDAPGVGRMAQLEDPEGGKLSIITYQPSA